MARKKKKPLILKKPLPATEHTYGINSGGEAWFGTEDRLTDKTSQKAGDVGAGLSARNWSPNAKPQAKLSPADAFVQAIISGDREQIKEAYGDLGMSDAAAVKAHFVSMPVDQRKAVTATVDKNKDLFNPLAYSQFRLMMITAPAPPKGAKPLNFEPVGLEGQDAQAAIDRIAGGSSAHAGLAGAINREATRLGIAPVDLATAIGYETIGTFSPNIRGGAGDKYVGLIQFGPAEQKHYGIVPGMSADDQMVKVGDFLRDRGLKPGMGLLDIYSTINAGSPGHYGARDASGKTVRQHVAEMQASYGARAARLVAGELADGAGQDVAAGGAKSAGGADVVAKAIQANRGHGLGKGSHYVEANKAIQAALNGLGVTDRFGHALKEDGVFGNRTKEAVKSYQAKQGIVADGKVGRVTFGKISADMTPESETGAGMVGSPELAGQVKPSAPFNVGAGIMPGAGSISYAAGAAAAAVTVDPHVARAFVPSGKATLMAALDHPDETFTSSNREWDPAAARIANTLRDSARMDAEVKAAMGKAGKTQFAQPIEADTGVKVPKSFSEWLGPRPGEPIQQHQAPEETGLAADARRAMDSISRGFDVEHWLSSPTASDSPYNSGSFDSNPSDPYRPTGGYEPGGSNSSGSFDDFAAGMSSTYQTVQGGGSVVPTYEPGGSNTSSIQTDAAGRVLGGI